MFVFIVREYFCGEYAGEEIYPSHKSAMSRVIEICGCPKPKESEEWAYSVSKNPWLAERVREFFVEQGEEATCSVELIKYALCK